MDEVDGRMEGSVRVREVSPILNPVDPVGEVRPVRLLVVAVRERSRGIKERGTEVRVEGVARVERVAVVRVRDRMVGTVERVVERRVEGAAVMGVDRVRDVTLDRVVEGARDAGRGDGARRMVTEVRGRVLVEGGLAVRGLGELAGRTDLVVERLRELGVDRERDGAGELRDGVDFFCSSLLLDETLLRLREDAATTLRRGNRSGLARCVMKTPPEPSCPSPRAILVEERRNAEKTIATARILFIFPPSYKLSQPI